ncbi:thiamine pyrophosphate-binding protein [Bordetella petrii]|uniref:thiamine pyrophosphate-binding protein n=1 Tax=Bordetella petrii TaxID=94624 RepID=UPI001E40B85E|nr:thiamine pyrophosphate-binding protein [Bordetella petrii]MCD0502306.1 thiamine pyrophosphate-binding protein [Bordetella petrii]
MGKQASGRDIFLELLLDEGITHFFGNPGTTELPIIEALPRHPDLQYVLGLQEAVVVAMADGYSRATGRLTACNLHCAPGLGNAMGAIYNAKFSGSPIIITAGQYEIGYGLTEPLLYEPLVQIAQPLVKWAVEVQRPEDLPRIVRRAAKIAMTPPMGPVFISLPGSVLHAEVDVDFGKRTRIEHAVRPTDAVIEAVAGDILRAKKPVIIAGSELELRDAFAEAAAFAELIGAPVYVEPVPYNARFPNTHPLAMGDITRNQPQVRKTLSEYDLLICLGADLLRMSPFNPVDPMPSGLNVVHISERPWELGKNYHVEHAICANVKATLTDLNAKISGANHGDLCSSAQQRVNAITSKNWQVARSAEIDRIKSLTQTEKIHPDELMLGISEYLPDTAIVVEESLTTASCLAKLLKIDSGCRYFGLASGGLGFGLAGAVGVSLAHPDKQVVAVLGDGSSMYGIQGLWTAAHFQLAITFVIVNNRSYRILKDRMPGAPGAANFIGMDFDNPPMSFVDIAHGLGLPASKVRSQAELQAFLESLESRNGPRLVEVIVDNGY